MITSNLSKSTTMHSTPPTKTPSYMPSNLANTKFDMTSKSNNMEGVRQSQETTTRCIRCKIEATYVSNTSNSTMEKIINIGEYLVLTEVVAKVNISNLST